MHKVTVRPEIIERVMARRGRHHLYDSLEPGHCALLVIDMMNMFMAEGAPAEVPMSRQVVEPINRLTAALRPLGVDIFWITRAEGSWDHFLNRFVADEMRERTRAAMEVNSWGQELWPALRVEPGDIHRAKHRYSAFTRNDAFEDELRARGIDTLLIAGTKTNICCESTARDGMMRDFDVVMVEDCCAALSDEEHQIALENVLQQFGDVMTSAEVVARMAPASGLRAHG